MSSFVIRGVHDVVSYIDARPGISGRAGLIWWLALGGLFLDAFSNSALSAALAPMTRDLQLSATQVAVLTSLASWVAIVFNPHRRVDGRQVGGRIPPLVFAKFLALAGAAFAAFAPSFELVLVGGRFFVGGRVRHRFRHRHGAARRVHSRAFKSRLNTWQGIWYCAVSANLLLAIMFYNMGVGGSRSGVTPSVQPVWWR